MEYTPKQKQEIAKNATVIPAVSQRGPVLEVGEVRVYLALQDVDGNTTGWIEIKRGVDSMEKSLTLDQGERILRKDRGRTNIQESERAVDQDPWWRMLRSRMNLGQ